MDNATGICLLIQSHVYGKELGSKEMLTTKFGHRRVAVFWDLKLYTSIRSRPILQTPVSNTGDPLESPGCGGCFSVPQWRHTAELG